jgi:hypothetical protein
MTSRGAIGPTSLGVYNKVENNLSGQLLDGEDTYYSRT